MLCLYYVQMIGDGSRLIQARHPHAHPVAELEEDDRAMTRDEHDFVKAMGVDVSGEFHIRNQGSGVRNLLRIYSAWRSAPEALHYIQCPEVSLHPGIQAEFAEWLTGHGLWVAETCSEMFALRLARLGKMTGVDVFVLNARDASAAEQLSAAATGLPTCTRAVVGDDGMYNPWPDDFFHNRLRELL